MISMSKAYSIRQLRMEGDSIAEISRKLEVSRDTVYKYLAMDDLSQRPPAPRAKGSVLDRYRPLIESWLDEDERNWRKQRHTARRIWARLRDRAQLRQAHQARARREPRAVPRPRLGAGRRAGGLRRGRLLRRRRAHAHELLRHDVPLFERGHRPGVPRRERRVRVPGAAQHIRARGGRAQAHPVRQRCRRGPPRRRRRLHHRDVLGLRRPLRVRLLEAPMYVNLLFSPEISAKHRILPGTGHSSDGRSRRSLPFGIRR